MEQKRAAEIIQDLISATPKAEDYIALQFQNCENCTVWQFHAVSKNHKFTLSSDFGNSTSYKLGIAFVTKNQASYELGISNSYPIAISLKSHKNVMNILDFSPFSQHFPSIFPAFSQVGQLHSQPPRASGRSDKARASAGMNLIISFFGKTIGTPTRKMVVFHMV